jgi:hypothetical protein
MDENTINLIKKSVENLGSKEFNIHFFIMDTKGNPVGGVANIYEHVKVLKELGYNASILHEKNDYTPVTWLGEEYTQLPHYSAESKELKINPEDFIIIPEIYANVMEQVSKLPGKKIVLCQSYDYILEMLMPGKSWRDFGIRDCITTSEKQKEYINNLFSNTINVDVIPVSIPEYFKPTDKDKKPIVGVMTRDQRDLVKIFKAFYLRHPHLKWITFRDMRGLPREVFASELSQCCLSVWVDDIAGFGTFPLESIECDVPVLAKVPNMVPEYFTDKNGLWVHDVNSIPDLVANFVQAWLEDSEPSDLYNEMESTRGKYTEEQQKGKIKEVYEKIFTDRKNELESSLPNELEGEVIEMGDDNTNTEEITLNYLKVSLNSVITNKTLPKEVLIVVTPDIDTKIVQGFIDEIKEGKENDLTFKIIENDTDNHDFCSQINLGVEQVKTEFFSILEVDDQYATIWFDNFTKYNGWYEDVDMFLPLVIDVNIEGRFLHFTNEPVWAKDFSDKQGFLDNDSLLNYPNFQLSGSVIKTESFKSVGGLKPSLKLQFIYEFMLRMSYYDKKMMTIPKVGYRKTNMRPGSLFHGYYHVEETKMDPVEARFWFNTARKESYFKTDRGIKYDKETA